MDYVLKKNSKCLLTKHHQDMIETIAKEMHFKKHCVFVKKNIFSGDNYLGNIYHVEIQDRAEFKKNVNLIIKAALECKSLRQSVPIVTFYKNEIAAYTEIFPLMEKFQKQYGLSEENMLLKTVKFFKSLQEEGKETLILQDASCLGYQAGDRRIPYDFHHAVCAIKCLAKFHALSFTIQEHDPELFERLAARVPSKINYYISVQVMIQDTICKILPSISNSDLKTRIRELTENAQENIATILDSSLVEPYSIICHGDCWTNNLLFKYKEQLPIETIFIDWQIIRKASPVTDLCYLLLLSTDKDVLEKHFTKFLNIYYHTLKEAILMMGGHPGVCFPKSVFKKHVKMLFKFGLLLALCLVPLILSENGEEQEMDASIRAGVKVNKRTLDRLLGVIEFCYNNDFI